MTTAPALGRRLGRAEDVPDWLRPLIDRIDGGPLPDRLRQAVPPPGARASAVLLAFAHGAAGPDLLLTVRAATLRSHPGQPSFPGGMVNPGESVVEAAVREGQEETGLDPASLTPLAVLPALFLAYSGFAVTPVIAHWHQPGPVAVVDPAETAAVARVPIADLVDPASRGQVVHPSGYVGPAFAVADMLIWGFTAGVLDAVLELGGWNRPWEPGRQWPLPDDR